MIHSFCPECGINVNVDEDGCCVTCGAAAMGPALKDIVPAARLADREKRIKLARENLKHVHTGSLGAAALVVQAFRALDLRRALPKPAHRGRR